MILLVTALSFFLFLLWVKAHKQFQPTDDCQAINNTLF